MSYLKLFRKEALKHQYKSQEFGSSVIEQPALLDRSLLVLIIGVVLLFILVASFPLISSQRYLLDIHDSNYLPLMSPVPVVIERHLYQDGSLINTKQAVSQIRFFQNDSREHAVELLHSTDAGFYFALAATGEAVPAYQPIARILRINPEHLYFFWLTESNIERLKPGQQIELQAGQYEASGLIHSIVGPYQNNRMNIGVILHSPFDINLLNPAVTPKLDVTVKRRNIFELL